MSGAKGSSLVRYTDSDVEPFTQAQVDRVASHLRDHVSDPDERMAWAEALGLVGYAGHDTGRTHSVKAKGHGRPAWREPAPIEGEADGRRTA